MIRKKYSEEFKQDAISLVIDQKYTRTHAAESLGVHPSMLGKWIREHKQDAGNAFRGNGVMTEHDRELHTLKSQVKRLTMEASILKKAVPLLAPALA